MKFGDNLKLLRKRKNLSQEDLAEKIGVSRQSVSKWETGDAYPEMNNILCLCQIFNCHINELVHEDFEDLDNLGEEIKMNVIKFKKEKQKKVKLLSKIIYIVARILKIITIVGISCVSILTVCTPIVINNTKITENKIVIFDNEYEYKNAESGLEIDNNNIIKIDGGFNLVEYYNSHSKIYFIIIIEVMILSLIATLVFTYLIFKQIEKLFININEMDTPFVRENPQYIKKISKLIIISTILNFVVASIVELITKIPFEMELELTHILLALIIYALGFIFEYGYEIQLDSKGRIYGEENE